jgi:alpha-galactosidase
MSPASLAVLKNPDVIAVDQDKLGRQGRRVHRGDHVETWVRKLSHGATAVLLFNRSGPARSAKVKLADVPGLRDSDRYEARELWTGESITLGRSGTLSAKLGKHAVAMWRVRQAP